MNPSGPMAAASASRAAHGNADLLGALFEEPPPAGGPRELGDYELLEEVAAGGMGVVWRARQRSLNRIVALKTIRAAHLARPEDVARFRAEAAAAAGLRHPGIVTVHEIGEEEGQHFFTMELVAGPNLARRLREGSLPVREAASLLRDIARAVQHAHECGVLHRDLKPSNILLRADGQPCVSDFGLAKAFAHGSELTLSGTVLGSPSYMPPEQAQGRVQDLDARGDVYALGAILYEALTGRPPFQGETAMQTLKHVMENEPVPPRLHCPEIPRDLETICLKCLAKEPARRYPTAAVLAEDLDRFLRHEPIHARPVGVAGKVVRWARRKPALAATLAALLVVFVSGALGVLFQWRRAVQGEALLRQTAYDTAMLLANHSLQERNYGLVSSLLERTTPKDTSEPDLRGWEWRRLARCARSDELFTLGRHGEAPSALAVSPDTNLVVSASPREGLKIWDLDSRRQIAELPGILGVKLLAFSPRGRWLAAGTDYGKVFLLDTREWQPRLALSVKANISGVQFSLDEQRLFVAQADKLSLLSVPAGAELSSEPLPENNIVCLTGDASVALLNTRGSTFVFTNLVHGGLVTAPWPHPQGHYLTAISHEPRANLLATAFNDHSVVLWDMLNARQLFTLRHHTENVQPLAFDLCNQRLASAGGDQVIVLSSLRDGARLDTLVGHSSSVRCLAFNGDGSRLVSGGLDGTMRVWDTARQHVEPVSLPVPPGYRRMSISANASRLLLAYDDGRCVVTNLLVTNSLIAVWDQPDLENAKFNADGEFLLVARKSGEIQLRRQRGNDYPVVGQVQPASRPPLWQIWNAAGTRMAAAWGNGEVVVLAPDPLRIEARFRLPAGLSEGWRVANFSPDGRWLVCTLAQRELVAWDLAAGRAAFTWPEQPDLIRDAAISPDGTLAATVCEGRPVVFWALKTGAAPRELAQLKGEGQWARSLAFSPDGGRLAIGSESGEVTLLNAATRQPVASLRANDLPVYRLWFHGPDDILVTLSPGALGLWRAGRN